MESSKTFEELAIEYTKSAPCAEYWVTKYIPLYGPEEIMKAIYFGARLYKSCTENSDVFEKKAKSIALAILGNHLNEEDTREEAERVMDSMISHMRLGAKINGTTGES